MALLAITAGFGALAFAQSQRFLYVVNVDQANPFNNTSISQFSIGTNGTLTALSPATVNVGGAPGGLFADPNGRFLYLAQPGPPAVLQFTINNNGTLGSATPATSNNPDAPWAVVIDPSHQFAYVENESVQSIFQYSVSANGAFTGLNPPRLVNGSAFPLALHPSGRFAYASNALYGIYQYAIGAGGALTQLNPASVLAGSLPGCIAMHPTGNFVYVVNIDDNTISQFAVNAGGTLSSLSPAAVPVGNFPIGNYPGCLAVHPNGNFLYLATSISNGIYQYGIGANGTLAPLSPASLATGNLPVGIYLDPTGSFAYVPSPRDGTISQYSIGANGTLAPLNPATVASTGAGSIAIATVIQSIAPTCTDNSGVPVQLGGKQFVPCPAGQVGTSACPPLVPNVVGPGLPNCATETCIAPNTGAPWSMPPDFSNCAVQCIDPNPLPGQPSTYNVGATEIGNCPSGFVGTTTRTCRPDGTFSDWNKGACTPGCAGGCPSGQLCCFNTLSGGDQCAIQQGGFLDSQGVLHAWCGNLLNDNLECNNCAAGVPCEYARTGKDTWTTDMYCGGGSSYVPAGGTDVALLTFLALMTVWSARGVWRLRKRAAK